MAEPSPSWQFERLCALWVLAESGLGGWLHSLKIPLTGIFLGGTSVVILALLAWNQRQPAKRIMEATLLVASFKLLISPQAPIQAYFALFFQAFCGTFFFSLLPSFRLACWMTGFFALAESGAQKFLIASVWMGEDFWNALTQLSLQVGKWIGISSEIAALMPITLVTSWTLFHAFGGLFIGIGVSRWILNGNELISFHQIPIEALQQVTLTKLSASKKKSSKYFKWILGLSPVLITAWFSNHPLALLGRLIFLPALGLLVVFPLFKFLLKQYDKKHTALREVVQFKLEELQQEWPIAWKLSGILTLGQGRLARWSLFLRMLLQENFIAALMEKMEHENNTTK